MARFEPFPGVLYNAEVDLGAVTAPPYDVVSAAERAALAERHDRNMVHVDCPPPGGHEQAGATLRAWLADGTLLVDEEPAFYVYRMSWRDALGRPRQTIGVVGALGLEPPGAGDVLPHERTTPKAASDRLSLLRATDANLSPVWGLSLTPGLSALCEGQGQLLGGVTDPAGVHHRLYRVTSTGVNALISEAVGRSPVVIADGHHRYQTCLQYREERRAALTAAGIPEAGPHDLTLALVVELSPQQLHVQAIHRLLSGVPAGTDLVAALEPWFEPLPCATPAGPALLDEMDRTGALALVRPGAAAVLLRPRPECFADLDDLDSARLDRALADAVPEAVVTYQHGVERVTGALDSGGAEAGVLLRPVPVATIEAMARGRRLMPPKSTFFAPKPLTGMVLRLLS